jgi:hypothetical protein
MKVSRPFRFLLLWLGFWAGLRVTDVWRRGVTERSRIAMHVDRKRRVARSSSQPEPRRVTADGTRHPGAPAFGEARRKAAARHRVLPVPMETALVPPLPAAEPRAGSCNAKAILPVARLALVALPPLPTLRSRITGSGWLIVRAGGETSVPASQIGGSQAGLRLTYPVDSAQRIALSARLSAPLAGTGGEIALGIDWQPTRAPVHVLAEQRVSIDGGPSGPMLGMVGGFGPTPVGRDLTLEGYGQAGVVARSDGGLFADGAVRAAHPLGRIGGVAIDAGAGLWGGVQPGAGRLDIGPTVGLVLPLKPRIRLAADWRQRVAGPSRPGSGPALSLGTGW